MAGLGLSEIALIFVIALVVFGPKKLPELGKSLGRAMAEFKKASEEFQESMRDEMRDLEKTSGLDDIKKMGRFELSDDHGHKTDAPNNAPRDDENKKTGGAERNA